MYLPICRYSLQLFRYQASSYRPWRLLRKNAGVSSFQGAAFAREPGIHEHLLKKSRAWPVFIVPGSALKGRPGTAAEFFRVLLLGRSRENARALRTSI